MNKLVYDRVISIKLSELKGLVEDSVKLRYLEGYGVDNWAGYGEVDWDSISEEVEEELLNLIIESDERRKC
jgi:hypothetical protein